MSSKTTNYLLSGILACLAVIACVLLYDFSAGPGIKPLQTASAQADVEVKGSPKKPPSEAIATKAETTSVQTLEAQIYIEVPGITEESKNRLHCLIALTLVERDQTALFGAEAASNILVRNSAMRDGYERKILSMEYPAANFVGLVRRVVDATPVGSSEWDSAERECMNKQNKDPEFMAEYKQWADAERGN